jgi:hypothetical protein
MSQKDSGPVPEACTTQEIAMAEVFGLAKVPGGSRPKHRTKMAKTNFGPESPALEKAEIIKTKTAIT